MKRLIGLVAAGLTAPMPAGSTPVLSLWTQSYPDNYGGNRRLGLVRGTRAHGHRHGLGVADDGRSVELDGDGDPGLVGQMPVAPAAS